jgi:hypothetical protein
MSDESCTIDKYRNIFWVILVTLICVFIFAITTKAPELNTSFGKQLQGNLVDTDNLHEWEVREYDPCSASCGGGYQERTVTCIDKESKEEAYPHLCTTEKPKNYQSCNESKCKVQTKVENLTFKRCSYEYDEFEGKLKETNCKNITPPKNTTYSSCKQKYIRDTSGETSGEIEEYNCQHSWFVKFEVPQPSEPKYCTFCGKQVECNKLVVIEDTFAAQKTCQNTVRYKDGKIAEYPITITCNKLDKEQIKKPYSCHLRHTPPPYAKSCEVLKEEGINSYPCNVIGKTS